jgi:hypothetical protein
MPFTQAVLTTARTAAFIPGASPPLVNTAIVFITITIAFQATYILKITNTCLLPEQALMVITAIAHCRTVTN